MMAKFSSGALVRPEPWGPLSRARGQACRGGEAERGGASASCGQGAARGAAPVASRRRVVAERRGRGRKRKG